MAEETRVPGTAEGDESAESGWSSASRSAPAETVPADTTLATIETATMSPEELAASKPAAKAAVKAAPAKSPEDGDEETVGEKGRGGKPASRVARINELSGKNRVLTAERDAERAARASEQQRIQDLETRLRALEAPKAESTTKAKPTTATEDVGPPDPPVYAEFETDADYAAAVKTWRTETAAWQAARDTRLTSSVTEQVEARFKQERADRAAADQDRAVMARLAKIHTTHPDFAEKAAANAALEQVASPFLHDMITNTEDGPELLYDLVSDPEMALALGALELPTRPLADAVRSSPQMRTLIHYFATDDGAEEFQRLRMLQPVAVIREIGRLEARLEAADRGPAPLARPITSAIPPAKPPVGAPRAHARASGPKSFDDWMAEEDARELRERRAELGLPA